MTGAISQDWESCQFPFVLDEKPTFVPGGSAGEGSGGKRKVSYGDARSNSEQAAPSACVGKRYSVAQEGLMITVEYAPGGSDPLHRHKAHAFVYVLEGSVMMQVKGGKEVTLTPGQTFYEGTDDVHVVGRNASSTKPAKFLVFFIKDKGAPVLVPVPE